MLFFTLYVMVIQSQVDFRVRNLITQQAWVYGTTKRNDI